MLEVRFCIRMETSPRKSECPACIGDSHESLDDAGRLLFHYGFIEKDNPNDKSTLILPRGCLAETKIPGLSLIPRGCWNLLAV